MEEQQLPISAPVDLIISQLRVYGFHGVRSQERKLGGKYEVDVELTYDAAASIRGDDLQYAVNYEKIARTVSKTVKKTTCQLIETLVHRVAAEILEKFPAVATVKVRLRKYALPMPEMPEYVQVERRLSREEIGSPLNDAS